MPTYTNRKKHSGGTFHTWTSVPNPDPDMDDTTPPNPKNEYSDHVILDADGGGSGNEQ